eukprot:TRINITY_DN30619_c0_g1_i1.p1 TRINITY_DN30619_c0_g1~~TRINITY_DN30619_c0_g1_i1.p1  ORF type:complete len:286 (+),score=51.83 TRINITY_DN30619_c0_g1_i1:299-1156(+)
MVVALPISPRLPVLFISHGSPMSGFRDDETSQFWKTLGAEVKKLPGIRAILMVSGHWEERPLRVNSGPVPETIYDFYGFPSQFYKYKYPGKGEPQVAQRVMQLLTSASMPCQADSSHGLDHGSWVPLKWMMPKGELPVLQLSLLDRGSMQDHVAMGKALAPLRDEGVLIVGSGTAVHNLRDMGAYYRSQGVADYVAPFDLALEEAIVAPTTEAERIRRLLALERSPLLRKAHPSIEHLLPLHVAGGAAGEDRGRKIFHLQEMSFSSASFVWGDLPVVESVAVPTS